MSKIGKKAERTIIVHGIQKGCRCPELRARIAELEEQNKKLEVALFEKGEEAGKLLLRIEELGGAAKEAEHPSIPVPAPESELPPVDNGAVDPSPLE